MAGSLIPIFAEINEHYAAVGVSVRTQNSDFHIARLSDLEAEAVGEMPPYRNGFYEIVYGKNVTDLAYTINGYHFSAHPYFLLFSAPYQVHSWIKRSRWEGYVVSLKENFLQPYLREDLLQNFPFFGINEANFLNLTPQEAAKLEVYLAELTDEQTHQRTNRQEMIKTG